MQLIYALIRVFLQQKGHGFSVRKAKNSVTKRDFAFGDGQLEIRFGGTAIVKPDGQWDNDLPDKELQKFDWGDTYHCTVYGDENMVQTLKKAKYGESEEYSERFLGVLAGIVNNFGGSPHTVFEKWRRYGNVGYDSLPFEGINNWTQFNSPNPMSGDLIAEGERWLEKWSLGHDWIWDFRHSVLKDALKYSPLGVGVYAWAQKDDDTFYKPGWAKDNHWVMMYGYVEGKHWKVYDHYDNVFKKLDWNYPFAFAKRITLEKKTISEVERRNKGKSLYERLQNKHIIRPESNGEVYHVLDGNIKFCFWVTDCKWMQDNLNQGLQDDIKRGEFIGISEVDYANLMSYVTFAGIPVENPKDKMKGLIK